MKIYKRIIFLILLFTLGCSWNSNAKNPSMSDSGITVQDTITATDEIQCSATPTPYKGNWTPEPIVLDTNYGITYYGDVYKDNGYYYQENNLWIPGIPIYESQYLYMPLVVKGSVWAYNPNLMEHTAKFHELTLKDVEDGITVPFCSMIGSYVWVKRPYDAGIKGTGEWEGPFKVVDCAGILDIYNVVVNRGEIAEVGFQTAYKWTMVKRYEEEGLDSVVMKSSGENTFRWYWDFRRVDNVILSFINPKCLSDSIKPVDLKEWFIDRVYFYKTQEEFNNSYKPLYKVINKVPSWKFSIDGSWESFDLNNINGYCK